MKRSRSITLVLLLSVGLGAWSGLLHLEKEIGGNYLGEATIADYRELGATFSYYGYQLPIFHFKVFPQEKLPNIDVPFGLGFRGASVTATDLRKLAHLKNLKLIGMAQTQISDDHLAALREIGLLYALRCMYRPMPDCLYGWQDERPMSADDVACVYLDGSKVTEAGLKELLTLKNVHAIGFGGTVTDDGVKTLAGFKKLASLSLADSSGITKAGLAELATFKSLSSLRLSKAKLTPTEIEGLKAALPQCNIRID